MIQTVLGILFLLFCFVVWVLITPKKIYLIQDDVVYFMTTDGYSMKLDGADPATFKEIRGRGYGKDKSSVFYYQKRIEGADGPTFELFKWGNIGKDKSHVFIREYMLPQSDATSFQILNDAWERESKMAKDREHVFLLGDEVSNSRLVQGADASTFKVLFAKTIYLGMVPKSLIVSQDAKHVYVGADLSETYDVSSFTILKTAGGEGSIFARDGDRFFNLLNAAKLNADPATFKVIDEQKAQDKSRTFNSASKD